MSHKRYIGDSVYVELDELGRGVRLTTENGLPSDPSNIIFLDSSVIASLLEWLDDLKKISEP